MKRVTLGFKAYDLHELTCHVVAGHAGLYRRHGLDVVLEDTRRIPDDRLPESWFSAACGAALLRWLRGAPVRVVVVASARPMFWLYSNGDVIRLEDLRGRSVATYPEAAPPARFLRLLLEECGIEGDVQQHVGFDDAARLEMLRTGRAAAALISSGTPPRQISGPDCRLLLCLGDRIRVPTTGLAVSESLLQEDRQTVLAMRDAFRAALRMIAGDRHGLVAALAESDLVDAQDAEQAAGLVQRFYTTDGRIHAGGMTNDIKRIADSLGVGLPADPASLYDAD